MGQTVLQVSILKALWIVSMLMDRDRHSTAVRGHRLLDFLLARPGKIL